MKRLFLATALTVASTLPCYSQATQPAPYDYNSLPAVGGLMFPGTTNGGLKPKRIKVRRASRTIIAAPKVSSTAAISPAWLGSTKNSSENTRNNLSDNLTKHPGTNLAKDLGMSAANPPRELVQNLQNEMGAGNGTGVGYGGNNADKRLAINPNNQLGPNTINDFWGTTTSNPSGASAQSGYAIGPQSAYGTSAEAGYGAASADTLMNNLPTFTVSAPIGCMTRTLVPASTLDRTTTSSAIVGTTVGGGALGAPVPATATVGTSVNAASPVNQTITSPAVVGSGPSAEALSSTPVGMLDSLFVTKATDGNLAEISLAQLALQRSSDPVIRNVAQRMIRDHSAANEQLQQVAQASGITLSQTMGPTHQAVMRQLLNAKGAAFDRFFMSALVEDHENTIALYQQEAAHGTVPSIRNFASRTLPTLVDHARLSYSAATRVGAPVMATRVQIQQVAGQTPNFF